MGEQPIALITGGAQGIGYACAEAIAENGAKIVLSDINADGVEKAAERLGGGTVAIACDMGAPATSPRCSTASKPIWDRSPSWSTMRASRAPEISWKPPWRRSRTSSM